MEIIKWDKSLESSVEACNIEHKYLVDNINKTYTLLREGHREEAKNLLVNVVVEYTDKHFKHEEDIMKKYGYPEEHIEKQKKMHRFFVKHIVNDLVPQIENGGEKEFVSVLNFIVGWLIMHIQNMDVAGYGKWFDEHGVKVEDKPINLE